jgi:hypothetical protein
MWEGPYTNLLHPNEHEHNMKLWKGCTWKHWKKNPCHKKKGIFLHTTLRHEKKFDVFARGKKRKKPLSVQKMFYILHASGSNE